MSIIVYFIGTFLTNCESDREFLELSQKTVSLWSHLSKPHFMEKYLNPLYIPNNKIIWPSVAPMSLVKIYIFLIYLIYIFYIVVDLNLR